MTESNLGISPFVPASLCEAVRAVLPSLNSKTIETILSHAQIKKVHSGEILMHEGELCSCMGWVIEGALGMAKSFAQHPSHIIGLLLAGDSFGRIFNGPILHRIEALADTSVLCIERDILEEALRINPDIEHQFIVSMLSELEAARTWVLLMSGTLVHERVAAFLAILAKREIIKAGKKNPKLVVVQFPMARKNVARCLGIRKESLSRGLHKLEREGLIRIRSTDKFEIYNLAELLDAFDNDLNFGGR